jgi:hypothetical protein
MLCERVSVQHSNALFTASDKTYLYHVGLALFICETVLRQRGPYPEGTWSPPRELYDDARVLRLQYYCMGIEKKRFYCCHTHVW